MQLEEREGIVLMYFVECK